MIKIQNLTKSKKANFPSLGGRGSRGGGYKWMKFNFIHPHPNPWSPLAPPKAGKPLPSRERGL
jgi:hypothetical protein